MHPIFTQIKDVKIVRDLKSLAQERGWLYRVADPPRKQMRYPSNTIQSQVERIIRHGKEQAAQFDRGRAKDLLEAERFIARLYAAREYTIKETFSCEVPNVSILKEWALAITPDPFWLMQSSIFVPKRITSWRHVAALALKNIPELAQYKEISGKVVCLTGAFENVFGHWIRDYLPRLTFVDVADPDLKVLIPLNTKKFHIELLNLMGIPDEKLVRMDAKIVNVETLIVCHAAQHPTLNNAKHLHKTVRRLREGAEVQVGGSRRIYLSRSKVGSRAIVNEQELLPLLDHYGFEHVIPEDLSSKAQMQLFGECKVLLGAHGSGMMAQLVCQAGCTVIEIYSVRSWDQAGPRVAAHFGNTHWHLWADSVDDDFNMRVDIVALDELLSTALRQPAYHDFVRAYLDAYPDAPD